MSIESPMPSNHLISVVSFSSCLQSFPASSGDQSIGPSASASVLPMNSQDWFPLGWTSWISLLSKGLSRVFSNTSLKASTFWHSAFFLVQLSHSYMTTGKTIALTAAAKSLQSCPTLCDPTDGSPPGSPVPGTLQARTLEWLPFPSPMHEIEKWKWSHSVMSNPQRPHGLQPFRLLHPWDFPGKSTGKSSFYFAFSQTLHVAFLSSDCYKMSHCRHIKFYSSTSVGTYINVTTCSLLPSTLLM